MDIYELIIPFHYILNLYNSYLTFILQQNHSNFSFADKSTNIELGSVSLFIASDAEGKYIRFTLTQLPPRMWMLLAYRNDD